jgi:hypothetical protein
LDGLPSSAFVAKSFTGAKLVKGFNHLGAAKLATDPIVEGGHRVVFLSRDDEDATAPVADLAKELGFAPVKPENVQVVKDFVAAMGGGDKQALLSWIVPGEDWPLAGTYRGHAGLWSVLRKASEEIEMT